MSILCLALISICLTAYGFEEKKISVVVPSYNNEKYVEQNLKSIVSQDYKNFEIVYVNDASTDKTLKLVTKFLSNQQIEYKIISHEQNRKPSFSRWHGINLCDDNNIIVLVDGDDWLPHKNILKEINKAYQKNDIWLTYGSYETSSGHRPEIPYKIKESVIRNNTFRTYGFVYTHLRTFYSWLYKQIPLKMLIYNDQFIPMAADVAEAFCLIELANFRHLYIDKTMYIYNNQNILNEDKVSASKQMQICKDITKQKKLQPLKDKPLNKKDISLIQSNTPKNELIKILNNSDYITFDSQNINKEIIKKLNQTKAVAFLAQEQADERSISIQLSNDKLQLKAKIFKKPIKINSSDIYKSELILKNIQKINFKYANQLLEKVISSNSEIILHL